MICGYEALPCTVGGFVKKTCEPEGDFYTIILNSRLSDEKQRKTYIHELEHIYNEDFKEGGVGEVESIRHK